MSSSANSRPRRSSASSTGKKASRKRSTPKPPSNGRRWPWYLLGAGVAVLVLSGLTFLVLLARTNVPSPNEVATSEATIVYWADGASEIGRLGDATRRSVPLADVPQPVQHAVLAAEDRGFYEHGGVSPIGVGRAIWNNLTGGDTQGGSTITQQYAKNAFLTQERSWDRKIKEALLATKLETIVSKDEILGDYLNTIFFGRDAYGIDAAAIAYFGKPVNELTVSQGAVLAAIIKSPGGLAPESNLAGLRARWAYVLDAMVDENWLSPQDRAAAQFPKILKLKAKNRLGGQTGFLLTMVQDQLRQLGFDDEEIERGGLRITTTFDKRAQRAAQAAVQNAGPSTGTKGLRIGLAAVRPGTGEVIAIYGGRDFIDDQINNGTRRFAQPGSTFKPFALAAATEQGVPLSSVWNGNSPSTVDGYTFSNYGDHSYGPVTLMAATENSINSAYVELESKIGVDAVADAAIRAGIPKDTPGMHDLNLTLVLGTASPSALDMANAYATFAAEGRHSDTTVLKRIVGPNGGLLYDYEPRPNRVFDADTANTVTYALNHVVTDGTAFAARALGRPAAAKTGTTDDNKSAWFVGYTPQIAAAVLMAKENKNGLPVTLSGTGGLSTVTGGSFPAAMWTAFMKGALEGKKIVDLPAPPAGINATLDCPSTFQPDIEVPLGCPTPTVEFEFTPDPNAPVTLPSDQPWVPPGQSQPEPQPSETAPVAPTQAPPAPTDAASTAPPPVEEGRPSP